MQLRCERCDTLTSPNSVRCLPSGPRLAHQMMLRCVADKGRNIQTLFILQKESATGHVINILKPLCRVHEMAMKPEQGGDGRAS